MLSATAKFLAALFLILVPALALGGCAGKKVTAQLSNDFGWSVKDPVLSRFTHICSNIDLVASGTLKKGAVNFHGLQISTDDQTSFSLNLKVPITESDKINFGTAKGFLTISKPIRVAGIPLPQKIVLQPGKASADVDLVGGLGDFLMNAITEGQAATPSGGSIGSIIDSVNIKSMTLDLSPGKALDLGRLHLVVGPSSTFALSNLKLDEHMNFAGEAKAALTFEKNCIYKGKKTRFEFNGGNAALFLHATKTGALYSFNLEPGQSAADLTDCSYAFGKFKQCLARSGRAELQVRSFICQEKTGAKFPLINSDSSMLLKSSTLLIKNPRNTFALASTFSKPIPAILKVDAADGEITSQWLTDRTNQADKVLVDITPSASTTTLVLGNTQIGPVTLSKEGDLDFSFDKGVSQLKQLKWSNGKKGFAMDCASGSTISIPPNMSMNVLKDALGTRTELPLDLRVGKATITGTNADSKIELNDIKGKVKLTVDNGTTISGGLDFSLVSCYLLGENTVALHADGLNFITDKGGSRIGVNVCKMNITNEALSGIINEQVPTEDDFDVNKTLLSKQKWRYRNATLKSVKVTHIKVKELVAAKAGEERFTLTGEVAADGTIEKGGLLSIIKKQHSAWEIKPWTASGDVEGIGTLKYQIQPSVPLTNSKVSYQLSLDLKPADNVELDWSKVDDGLLSKVESAIVTKFISSYDPKEYLKKASFQIFKKRSKKLDDIVVSKITTTPTDQGLCVNFSAQVKM